MTNTVEQDAADLEALAAQENADRTAAYNDAMRRIMTECNKVPLPAEVVIAALTSCAGSITTQAIDDCAAAQKYLQWVTNEVVSKMPACYKAVKQDD